jgi:hypothetical protein
MGANFIDNEYNAQCAVCDNCEEGRDLAVGQAIVVGGLPSSVRKRQAAIVCATPPPEQSSYFDDTALGFSGIGRNRVPWWPRWKIGTHRPYYRGSGLSSESHLYAAATRASISLDQSATVVAVGENRHPITLADMPEDAAPESPA